MKQVAVIILNWNGAELLRRYLPTVIAGTDAAIADVIVADNGSTDESLQVLQQEFPDVKILKFEKNYGFAEGYNLAIGQTMYPYTVLLNSDVRTPQGWLNPLLDYMEAHPGVGAVMPKLLHDREDDKQMFGFKVPVTIDARYQFGLTRLNKMTYDGVKNSRNSVFTLTVGYKFKL